jgi:hypothetical protein
VDSQQRFARCTSLSICRQRKFLQKRKRWLKGQSKSDEALAEEHAVLGFTILWYDWNCDEGENQFKRALELNPNSADAHWGYRHLLRISGGPMKTLAEAKRGRELDPLNVIMTASEILFLDEGRTQSA